MSTQGGIVHENSGESVAKERGWVARGLGGRMRDEESRGRAKQKVAFWQVFAASPVFLFVF